MHIVFGPLRLAIELDNRWLVGFYPWECIQDEFRNLNNVGKWAFFQQNISKQKNQLNVSLCE